MIITITLNPALDKTLLVDNFGLDKVNRIKDVNINAGGKGINASRVIHSLGDKTIALGFIGGNTGIELSDILTKAGINHRFVVTNDNTRINNKIVDTIKNTCTDLNEQGGMILQSELDELNRVINDYIKDSKLIVLAGSIPKGISNSIYEDIINKAKKNDVKTILDTSGVLLEEGIKAKPWMIKPNIHELSELLQKDLNTIDEVILESKKLVEYGITYVCVSMGEKGLLLVSKEKNYHAKPPKVTAVNTVGAGDSVVGSLAVSFANNEDIKEALKKACALSAAVVTLTNTDVPKNEYVKKFYDDVEVLEI